ncbi:TPA: 23S rRNA methyltransferase attenuation leader peptide, partial [Shigella flexneri]|nr:23S rRNA methyltransferase attenuation leader peptide [Shigella flexneri]HBE2940270.1 23S rRNA methyltransferase attenuation leader peptide [Escherichia coli]EFW0801960.1 23S rRNA methyltransferase attenuation leader peptide [Shigella flexneri]EFY3063474.1 23S rRNA methyltransferase attenuation leader peptide [Shigella flexneri]EKH1910312.1 23S rRNA methyltransferase attenuation leader peptide [Shigella flexneri]
TSTVLKQTKKSDYADK